MFNQLLESRAVRSRRPGGTLLSITLHAGLIAALVAATANATVPTIEERQEAPITFTAVDPPAPEPVRAHGLPTAADLAAAASNSFAPALVAPINIPNIIPDIDLSRAPADPRDFDPGTRGLSGAVPGGTGNRAAGGAAYLEWEVEQPATMRPGSRGPAYPEVLRAAGVEGMVIAQFVVDTLGRADLSTFRALKSEHAFFTSAVKHALEQMRFLPAEVGGRRVPQLVQQPFQFSIAR